MKRLLLVIMFLFFGAFGTSAIAAEQNHIVSKGESIWKISETILGDATIEEIDSLKDTIIIINNLNPELDDGIPTTKTGDPDYIVPGQVLITCMCSEETTAMVSRVPVDLPATNQVSTDTDNISDQNEENDEISNNIQRLNEMQEEATRQNNKIQELENANTNNNHKTNIMVLVIINLIVYGTCFTIFSTRSRFIFKRQ